MGSSIVVFVFVRLCRDAVWLRHVCVCAIGPKLSKKVWACLYSAALFEPAAGAPSPCAHTAMAKKRVSFGGASVLSFDTPMPPRSVYYNRTSTRTGEDWWSIDSTDGSVDGGKTVSRKTGVDVGDYVAIVEGSPDNFGLRGYVVNKFLKKKSEKLLLEIKRGDAVRFVTASVASVRVLAK